MSATRLVEVRHGGATTVRDFHRHAGLDLLPRLLVRNGELDPDTARSIVEARYAIAPDVAAMAARRGARAPAQAREVLSGAVDLISAAEEPIGRQRAALS